MIISLFLLRVLVNWKLSLSTASRSIPRESYLRSCCWVFTFPPMAVLPRQSTSWLHRIRSSWQRRHRSDFNHTNLKKVLPRHKQHVDCATCNSKIRDHCYTVFKADRATTRVPPGESDHATVVLSPTYRQKQKTLKPTKKTVMMRRTDESTEALRGCLECTLWVMFKEACPDLGEYADTVTSYIGVRRCARRPRLSSCMAMVNHGSPGTSSRN